MKLIVADLDGTLLHKKNISSQTIDTINKLKDQGYLFTLATGRHMQATKPIVDELKIELPVICTNGAFIYDFNSNHVIHQETIPFEVVENTLQLLNQYNLDYLIYTTSHIVSTQRSKEKLEQRIGQVNSKVITHETLKEEIEQGVLKILVIDERDDMIHHIKKMLNQESSLNMVQSQKAFLDIGFYKASKGRALTILAKYLAIDLSDILAIGDQENDISMIEVSGVGVAMGQGDEVLKSKANFITKSFNDEGFTYAINELILSK